MRNRREAMCKVSTKVCSREETVQEQELLAGVLGLELKELERMDLWQELVPAHRIEIKLVINSCRKNKNLNLINKAHSQKHFSLIEENLNFLIS